MLFLLFQLGSDRYALEASRVVEVVPLLTLRRMPQAPRGVAGVFSFHGRLVPAIDLSEVVRGQPASERLSTRIIVVDYRDGEGSNHLLGLIAEQVTDTLRREAREFLEPVLKSAGAPYLGPVLMDARGPVQWFNEQWLLPEPVRQLLFAQRNAAVSPTAAAPEGEAGGFPNLNSQPEPLWSKQPGSAPPHETH